MLPELGALVQANPGRKLAVARFGLLSAYALPPAGSTTVKGVPDCRVTTPLTSHPLSAPLVKPLAPAKNGS